MYRIHFSNKYVTNIYLTTFYKRTLQCITFFNKYNFFSIIIIQQFHIWYILLTNISMPQIMLNIIFLFWILPLNIILYIILVNKYYLFIK